MGVPALFLVGQTCERSLRQTRGRVPASSTQSVGRARLLQLLHNSQLRLCRLQQRGGGAVAGLVLNGALITAS